MCLPLKTHASTANNKPSRVYQDLAIEIATESSWIVVTCSTIRVGEWLDYSTLDTIEKEDVLRAIQFLDLGGHLERHPDISTLIRKKKPSASL